MDILLVPILLLIKAAIEFVILIVIANVILSWLIAANIFNTNNQFVYTLIDSISKLSGFFLNPIKKRIPVIFGMLDISPIVLILLLTFCENVATRILIRLS